MLILWSLITCVGVEFVGTFDKSNELNAESNHKTHRGTHDWQPLHQNSFGYGWYCQARITQATCSFGLDFTAPSLGASQTESLAPGGDPADFGGGPDASDASGKIK
jgi:hypothetical protein